MTLPLSHLGGVVAILPAPWADPNIGPIEVLSYSNGVLSTTVLSFWSPTASWRDMVNPVWSEYLEKNVTTDLFRGATTTSPVVVFTYCHQPLQGATAWYAFSSREERKLFLDMIETQGVGPKMVLEILSRTHYSHILGLIAAGDSATFCKLPKIGPKTGIKLVAELFKEPVKKTAKAEKPNFAVILNESVVNALVALGYKSAIAKVTAADAAQNANLPVDDEAGLIRYCLKKLLKPN